MSRTAIAGEVATPPVATLRLDKWLWAARFYRTRSLAAQAVEAGHVRVDGDRVKPAFPVRTDAKIEVRKRDLAWHVDVVDVSDRRGPASEAARLFRETPNSVAAREKILAERRHARAAVTSTRPTKRDRRKLEEFLTEP